MVLIWKMTESFVPEKVLKPLRTNAVNFNTIPASESHRRQKPWIFPNMTKKTIPYNQKRCEAPASQRFFIES